MIEFGHPYISVPKTRITEVKDSLYQPLEDILYNEPLQQQELQQPWFW